MIDPLRERVAVKLDESDWAIGYKWEDVDDLIAFFRAALASSTQDAPPLRDQFTSVATLPREPGYPEPHYFRDDTSTQDALDVEALAEAMAAAAPARPGIHAEAEAISHEYAAILVARGQK